MGIYKNWLGHVAKKIADIENHIDAIEEFRVPPERFGDEFSPERDAVAFRLGLIRDILDYILSRDFCSGTVERDVFLSMSRDVWHALRWKERGDLSMLWEFMQDKTGGIKEGIDIVCGCNPGLATLVRQMDMENYLREAEINSGFLDAVQKDGPHPE